MGWCKYCEGNNGLYNYYCNLNGENVPVNIVNNYCKYDYLTYKCPFYKEYGPSTSSSHTNIFFSLFPCFITTVTCDILGKDDNDPVMQKLRNFRDNVLQKNEEYYEILKLYDVIGPIIASNLYNDPEKELFTKDLYSVLERITLLIDKNEHELAVEKYRIMTLLLINRYNLKHLFNEKADNNFGYTDDNFDPQSAGHGISLVNPDFKEQLI